ncbi:MAG: precorrin-4 C(11)-methyltransferase [Magnetococcales bacterium]|nr:precorrin-4 C(11)-methyltransferase [Magnetococcales bacterium]NGZ28804.1 precorrin-4 C(11)-methyltransferase [Magnetococcales bacterium]
MAKVWFVGAGPGDVDLITVKGRSLIQQAGAILYAGSLVNPAHLQFAPPSCLTADSSSMTQQEMVNWLSQQANRHSVVVRLQTGDPSLFGAMNELIWPLREAHIEVEVVPGVSSALAAAAFAQQPLTLPEISQTVIFTRVEGRTACPDNQQLHQLASHDATLCLFLSATLGKKITSELLQAGWPAHTPMLLIHRVSYPDQRLVHTTLQELAATLKKEGMTGQTMIIAGPSVSVHQQGESTPSRLYAPDFSHGFRHTPQPHRRTPHE